MDSLPPQFAAFSENQLKMQKKKILSSRYWNNMHYVNMDQNLCGL